MRQAAEPRSDAPVTLSNPDRVLYPDQGLTKRQLAEYYECVAPAMLPHLAGRPLSLVRCPRGSDRHCFFQRHLEEAPAGIRQVTLKTREGPSDYLVIDDLRGLISLVQLGVLEIHPWGARADDAERPDRLVFDLDPGDNAVWEDVVHAARWLHGRLAGLGLRAFLRTTGGKGLHVVVPVRPELDWEQARGLVRAIAGELAAEDPRRYTVELSKAARVGKVLLDYLRNSHGASSIAAYSPRARRGAPVAAPLHWDELAQLRGPAQFSVRNVPARLAAQQWEPWADMGDLDQAVPARAPRDAGVG